MILLFISLYNVYILHAHRRDFGSLFLSLIYVLCLKTYCKQTCYDLKSCLESSIIDRR